MFYIQKYEHDGTETIHEDITTVWIEISFIS